MSHSSPHRKAETESTQTADYTQATSRVVEAMLLPGVPAAGDGCGLVPVFLIKYKAFRTAGEKKKP